jgi:hypothetical protein
MKTSLKPKYVVPTIIGLCLGVTFGHDQIVHRAITVNAADSALDNSKACAGFVNVVSSDIDMADAINYMVIGSAFEDNLLPPIDEGRLRSLNHFTAVPQG